MVSVNSSLRYLMMVGSALMLTGASGSASFADADTLPPPPPDEDTPKPVDSSKGVVQTYPIKKPGSATTVTVQTTTAPATSATVTTTVQTTPEPSPTTSAVAKVPNKPTNAEATALLNKAYSEMKTGAFVNAVKLLSEAVRVDTHSVEARRYLAYALIRTSRPGDAISQLLVLSNMLKPNVPNTFDNYNLGEAYLSTRNFKASQEAFKSVLAVDPKNDAARGGLIKAYAFDQKFPEAMTQLSLGQNNKDPKVQQYYKQLLELIYNTKTAATVGSAPTATVAPATTEVHNAWQQIGPK